MLTLCCCNMQELREKMDRQYSKGKPISFDAVALHDAAALLKLFLRELPEPLLMSERVNAFIQVDSMYTLYYFSVISYRILSSSLWSLFVCDSAC